MIGSSWIKGELYYHWWEEPGPQGVPGKKTIHFLANGLTAAFDGEARCPELQKPWIELFAEFLGRQKQNTTDWELNLLNGKRVRIFRDDDGSWDWR